MVSCIPIEMAKKHKLRIRPVDVDEPTISTYDGIALDIKGQVDLFLKCTVTGSLKMCRAIIIAGARDQEILLS